MMKRLLALVMVLAALCPAALAEEWQPLPLEGPAPYGPIADAYGEDGLSYDDGTLSVRIEKDVAYETNIYYIYVTMTDPTQLRTAVAGTPIGKTTRYPGLMAEENNAVLAVNGDFYTHNANSPGIIFRQGEQVRYNPKPDYDELFIDDKGDLTVISWTTGMRNNAYQEYAQETFDAYLAEHTLINAFSFGPALIQDGEVLEFNYREKTSCGYPTSDQRLVFCQLGELSYLFIACEGSKQGDGQKGLSIPEITELCVQKGAVQAYNLDGGNSLAIYFRGERINGYNNKDSSAKERDIKDIIYFATLRGE